MRNAGPRIAAVVIGVAAVACTLMSSNDAPYRPPGLQAVPSGMGGDRGEVLYQRDCAWCHGSHAEGTTNGPDLNGPLDGGAYTDYMLGTGRMPLSSPLAKAHRGTPAYPPEDAAAIVAHVASFGGTGPDVPFPDPSAGDLSRGEQLYQENCAACHSTTGSGGALNGGQAAPPLDRDVTAVQIAEAMLVGPGCPNGSHSCGPGEGAMPRFDFSSSDVDAITRYVASLQRPNDRGGAPLGRFGPVAEGAVGLLIGLGSLLLLARWIGTRSEERTP